MPHDRTTTSRRTRLAALGLATVSITLVGAVAYAADDPDTKPQAAASQPSRAYAWPSTWPTAWPTNWPRPTRTPRPTPTATPTATPTTTPTATASETTSPTATSTTEPTTEPTTSASSTPTTEPTPTVTATPTVEPTITATPTTSATPTPTPTATSSATVAPTPTADPDGYTERPDWVSSVLTELNAERAANGLPALALNTKLSAAAAGHNRSMAEVNVLSHQLDGEPGLGARVSAAGYSWSSCGENIAWNGNRSEAGVLAVQRSMYNETPPNDGHRRNILSTSFTEVGISVIDDSVHRKVWLVTDFGRPR